MPHTARTLRIYHAPASSLFLPKGSERFLWKYRTIEIGFVILQRRHDFFPRVQKRFLSKYRTIESQNESVERSLTTTRPPSHTSTPCPFTCFFAYSITSS